MTEYYLVDCEEARRKNSSVYSGPGEQRENLLQNKASFSVGSQALPVESP